MVTELETVNAADIMQQYLSAMVADISCYKGIAFADALLPVIHDGLQSGYRESGLSTPPKNCREAQRRVRLVVSYILNLSALCPCKNLQTRLYLRVYPQKGASNRTLKK